MTATKLSKRKDPRAQRSHEALRNALLTLIGQKSFEQISIRDITTAAGVSYPVFFRQFASKEDLLGDIATDEIKALLSIPFNSIHDSAVALCEFVQHHRLLWKTLMTAGAASIMRAEFIRIAKEIAINRGRLNPWLPLDLAASVTVAGVFEILAWWLEQPDDYPIAHVAQMLEALVLEPVMRPPPAK